MLLAHTYKQTYRSMEENRIPKNKSFPYGQLICDKGCKNIQWRKDNFFISTGSCRWILYQLSRKGSPRVLKWVPIPFQADLPDPGIEPGSSALQADSSPTELSEKPFINRVLKTWLKNWHIILRVKWKRIPPLQDKSVVCKMYLCLWGLLILWVYPWTST